MGQAVILIQPAHTTTAFSCHGAGVRCQRGPHLFEGGFMNEAVFAHRIQFAFTVMFHYLFPILTMGLGFFIALNAN